MGRLVRRRKIKSTKKSIIKMAKERKVPLKKKALPSQQVAKVIPDKGVYPPPL